MPERSRMAGEPNVPAEMTTSFFARTVFTCVLSALDWNTGFGTYSTPTARLPLHRQRGDKLGSQQGSEAETHSKITRFTSDPVRISRPVVFVWL